MNKICRYYVFSKYDFSCIHTRDLYMHVNCVYLSKIHYEIVGKLFINDAKNFTYTNTLMCLHSEKKIGFVIREEKNKNAIPFYNLQNLREACSPNPDLFQYFCIFFLQK